VDVTSPRWWFEDRRSGRIVVGQAPNPPLVAAAVAWLVAAVTDDDSTVHDVASVAATALIVWWALDEVARGVNPWRRLLGSAVLVWQALRVA
jgi:hypothetical protein